MPTRDCVRCEQRYGKHVDATWPRGDGYYCVEGCAAFHAVELARAAQSHAAPPAAVATHDPGAGVVRDTSLRVAELVAVGAGVVRDTSLKTVPFGTTGEGVVSAPPPIAGEVAPPAPETSLLGGEVEVQAIRPTSLTSDGSPDVVAPVVVDDVTIDDTDLPALGADGADEPSDPDPKPKRKRPSRRRKG